MAFDVQSPALDATRARLEAALSPARASRVQLVLASHADMERHVLPGDGDRGDGNLGDGDGVGVVCFNLGYLPGVGSDKSVVTLPSPRSRRRARRFVFSAPEASSPSWGTRGTTADARRWTP